MINFPPIKPHQHHHCPNTLPPPCSVRREIDAGLRVSLLGSRWPGVATSLLLLIVVGGSLSHLTTSLGTNVTYLTLFSPCTLRSALVLVITLLLNLTSLSPLQHIVTRLAQMVGSRQASAGSVALAYFRLAKLVCDSAWALIKLTVHARSVGAAHLRAFGVAMAQRSTRRLGACAANAWRICSSDVASCEQTKATPCAAGYWP